MRRLILLFQNKI